MDILKFGGTSVSSKDSLFNILRILSVYKAQNKSVIMVVSALKGITNKLNGIIELTDAQNLAYKNLFDAIKSDHQRFIETVLPLKAQALMKIVLGLLENEYETYLNELFMEGKVHAKDKDRILSFGEICSAQIIKMFLESNGMDFGLVDARKLIVTDHNFGNANVNWTITRKRIQDFYRVSPGSYVVTGFIGATANGSTTTLGRGGSDYTATIFASVLNAQAVVKWTDVNGIMTADPNKVANSYSLENITYEELLCLSKFGSNVLVHENSIRKLQQENIPLIIRNTFNTAFKGTLVAGNLSGKHKPICFRNACHIVSFPKKLKISKQVYQNIKSNNYLYFRIRDGVFADSDRYYYLMSDDFFTHVTDTSLCSNTDCLKCNMVCSTKVVYRDISLITIASKNINNTLGQFSLENLLLQKEIKTLALRRFQNGVSMLLMSQNASEVLNYLHEEISISKKEKIA